MMMILIQTGLSASSVLQSYTSVCLFIRRFCTSPVSPRSFLTSLSSFRIYIGRAEMHDAHHRGVSSACVRTHYLNSVLEISFSTNGIIVPNATHSVKGTLHIAIPSAFMIRTTPILLRSRETNHHDRRNPTHCTSGNRTAISPDCVMYRTQGRDGYCNCQGPAAC